MSKATKPRPRVNDASLCRVKGWRVGDVLCAEPSERIGGMVRAPRYVKLTAIGEASVLVREVRVDGTLAPERQWARHLLDYAMTLHRRGND